VTASLYLRLVLKKLDLQNTFDVVSSAQTEEFGKPHPAVYLTTAHRLGVHPQKCVAFEDSIRGIISAKAASMQCIAVPALEEREDPRFAMLRRSCWKQSQMSSWIHLNRSMSRG
jgi:mannitol-1-/sugar-/sorbitol-6-/2-deoxyglucose-6-phosphatase